WPAPSQVSQVLHTTGSQPARARLEMVIPNGLVKHMPVGHLRSHRSIHFLAGSILIALGIAGIGQVPVGVTPAGDCQASHRADDHYAFADESLHLFRSFVFCPLSRFPSHGGITNAEGKGRNRYWGPSIVFMMAIAAGPTRTTKIPGKINNTSGKMSCTAVLAAFSSAICRRRVRIESD